MSYAPQLRSTFAGIEFDAEDLYLLEHFQIGYLPERVPTRALAAVVAADARLRRFLVNKNPDVAEFVASVVDEFGPAHSDAELARLADELVWEIADLLIYAKHPEVYDERIMPGWHVEEIGSLLPVEDAVVIDAGAGTGRVAFAVADSAKVVFAVEPVGALRRFMRDKARRIGAENVFVLDGFLDAIPLPAASADALVTVQSIGWRLDLELAEIERVVKPGGRVVHLAGAAAEVDPLTPTLTSPPWNYAAGEYEGADGPKLEFSKRLAL